MAFHGRVLPSDPSIIMGIRAYHGYPASRSHGRQEHPREEEGREVIDGELCLKPFGSYSPLRGVDTRAVDKDIYGNEGVAEPHGKALHLGHAGQVRELPAGFGASEANIFPQQDRGALGFP
jgi:hypothetical protein